MLPAGKLLHVETQSRYESRENVVKISYSGEPYAFDILVRTTLAASQDLMLALVAFSTDWREELKQYQQNDKIDNVSDDPSPSARSPVRKARPQQSTRTHCENV